MVAEYCSDRTQSNHLPQDASYAVGSPCETDHGLHDDVKMSRDAVSNGMRAKGDQGIYSDAPHGDSIADPREIYMKVRRCEDGR
jgi:hypothetical protein